MIEVEQRLESKDPSEVLKRASYFQPQVLLSEDESPAFWQPSRLGVGNRSTTRLSNNFTGDPAFERGIRVIGRNAELKIGGFVKADFIQDLNAINSTDSFDTTTIYQITFGEGIGSYRGSPDIVPTGPDTAAILPMFGWMIGLKHEWSDCLTSNLTFAGCRSTTFPGKPRTACVGQPIWLSI